MWIEGGVVGFRSERKSTAIADEWTRILDELGSELSGRDEVNVHSSSAEAPFVSDVRSRRDDGCFCWWVGTPPLGCGGVAGRGEGDTKAAKGSACDGAVVG